jgi:hypothetical protein
MLRTGGLKSLFLFGTQRSARKLRLKPVRGQRVLGGGKRM